MSKPENTPEFSVARRGYYRVKAQAGNCFGFKAPDDATTMATRASVFFSQRDRTSAAKSYTDASQLIESSLRAFLLTRTGYYNRQRMRLLGSKVSQHLLAKFFDPAIRKYAGVIRCDNPSLQEMLFAHANVSAAIGDCLKATKESKASSVKS